MEQQTLEHIEQNAIARTATESLKECHKPLALVPNGYSIESLERFMMQPLEFIGLFTTSSLNHFLEYSKEQKETFCTVNPEHMSAHAFFDLGNEVNPGHGRHRSRLQLEKTAEFRQLLSIDGKAFDQSELAEWIEDWKEHITPINQKGEHYQIKQAVTAIRKVTINTNKKEEHEEQTFSANKTTLEQIDANSSGLLPEGFEWNGSAYHELSPLTIKARVSLLKNRDKPMFRVRLIHLESHTEKMADEFAEKLQTALKDKAKVYIGEFAAR